jgi:hypothetical protein
MTTRKSIADRIRITIRRWLKIESPEDSLVVAQLRSRLQAAEAVICRLEERLDRVDVDEIVQTVQDRIDTDTLAQDVAERLDMYGLASEVVDHIDTSDIADSVKDNLPTYVEEDGFVDSVEYIVASFIENKVSVRWEIT